MPVAAKIEEILLRAVNANCCSVESIREDLAAYHKDVSFPQLHVQLQMLPNLLASRNRLHPELPPTKKVTSVKTISDLFADIETGKGMLQEVLVLLKIYFTIPVSTSTAERSVSAIRRLKTYLRSTMTQQRLNCTMLLHVHKDRCDQLDLIAVAKMFISANERRKTFFGSFED